MLHRDLISALVAVEHLPKFQLTQDQVREILLGRRNRRRRPQPEGEIAMLDPRGELLALGVVQPGGQVLQPDKVLVDTHAMMKRK